jgi:tetratricopeptide (TPR) repeat protein
MNRLAVAGLCTLVAACSMKADGAQAFETGQRLLREGRAAEAVTAFQVALSGNDRWPEARYQLAEAYEASGNLEQAYRAYIRAADLLPDDPTAQLKAAAYLQRAKQYEDARTRAGRVVTAAPDNVDARIALSHALEGLRNLDGAVEQLDTALRLDPKRSDAYVSLGRIRTVQGQQGAAKAAFEQAVKIDDRSVIARRVLADFQWAQGDSKGAEATLKQALAIDATDQTTNRALATLYLETKQSAKAEEFLHTLVALSRTPQAQLSLADFYIEHEQFEPARELLESLRQQGAFAIAARTRLAGIEYAGGRHDVANQMIDALLTERPNAAEVHLAKARWLLDEGDPEQALEHAKMALAGDPRLAAGYYLRGVAEARTRRTPEAIASFTEVLRLNPDAVDAQIQLSTLHLSDHAIGSAVLIADQAVANAPGSIEARYVQLRAWIAAGDLARAAAALNDMSRMAPETVTSLELRGALLMRQGKRTEAMRAYDRALSVDPSSRAALLGLARLARTPADARTVRARFDARRGGVAEDRELVLAQARLSMMAGDQVRAERELRHSIAIDPSDVSNFGLLARLYREQHRLEDARGEFDSLGTREPANISARAMAAVLTHAMGDVPGAQKRYDEVLRVNPRISVAANNLAGILADAGERLEEAQRMAEGAVRTLPDNADVRDTLGWVYFRRAMYGKAVSELERTVTLAPSKADSHYHLGLAYSKSGDLEKARESLKTAVRLQPTMNEAATALQAISDGR